MVPGIPLTLLKAIVVIAAPAQIDCEEGVTPNVGFGLTVTIIVKVPPRQAPDVAVMLYVAVCGVDVGLVNVWIIDDALLPAVAPVIPPVTEGNPHE